MQPLTQSDLEMLKILTTKAQAGQASQAELMVMKDYTDRYLAYNQPPVQNSFQPQVNNYGMNQYTPNQQPVYTPQMLPQVYQQGFNQQPLNNQPPQYNMPSKYTQPFTPNGSNAAAPTHQTTVNNGVFKYLDNDTSDIYNQKGREDAALLVKFANEEAAKRAVLPKNEQFNLNNKVEEKKVIPSIPNKGSELPWLVPPHYVLHKNDDGSTYEYEVRENKGIIPMDFNSHEAIYNNRVDAEEYIIKLNDVNSLEFKEEVLVNDIDTALDHALLNTNFNNLVNKEHVVVPYLVANTFTAKRVSTDDVSYLFADIIAKSDNLISLSYNLKKILDSKDEITKKAAIKLDVILTENIMLVLDNVLNTKHFIESFITDIADLYVIINGLTDASKKNRITNALLSVFDNMKKDNALIYDMVKDDADDNVIGTTYYVEKITVVTTNSMDIHYELANVANKDLIAINADITPVINDLIDKVKDVNNTFRTYLVDYRNGNVYLTMKNVSNKMNTILRIR
jgi:hypothetical protein